LAADESGGPWLRARHAQAAKIPDTGPHWAVDPGHSGPERVDEKSQLNRHEQRFENNIHNPVITGKMVISPKMKIGWDL